MATTDGNDTVYGGQGYDRILAGGGDDLVQSYALADPALGQTDARMALTDAADILAGGSGDDTVLSGGGNDTVYGDYGDDWISAGTGSDVISGGLGDDIFVFSQVMQSPGSFVYSGRDVVTDFRQGEDMIDLTGYRQTYYGDGQVIFIGNTELAHSNNTLVSFHYEGNSTIVDIMAGHSYDQSDNPSAQIVLNGHINLSGADFLL